jgi:hypothetical protein
MTQLVEALRYKPVGRGFDSRLSYITSCRSMAPKVDSAFKTNEYQEYFVGVKAAGG